MASRVFLEICIFAVLLILIGVQGQSAAKQGGTDVIVGALWSVNSGHYLIVLVASINEPHTYLKLVS